jgi:hypothetical protein
MKMARRRARASDLCDQVPDRKTDVKDAEWLVSWCSNVPTEIAEAA